MALTKYRLGDLIELSEQVNSDLEYGADSVMGMTITKKIIPTKADTKNADLSKYLIVYPNEFIYNPRTHGKKIGLGFNNTDKAFLISWNNIAFRIKDSAKRIISPEYLFMHFNRDEWDRAACYHSWGSSTEVFSWDALCDMEFDLPPIEIQQKYVDIYNAMLANQKAYEQGLDDLKLTCDAKMDCFKNNSNRVTLSDILSEIDIRNTNDSFDEVKGINIEKTFMKSVANLTSTDLTKYKIVQKGQFVYSAMQTGRDECIRIALLDEKEPIIVSPAYSVLQCNNNVAIPEYIMLWFSRKESDRFGAFCSDASIRANLDLSRFFEFEIPVPSIQEQVYITNMYKAYTERRAINEKLKSQIKDICPILIKGSLQEAIKNDRL